LFNELNKESAMALARNRWLLAAALLIRSFAAAAGSTPDAPADRFAKLKADYDADLKAVTKPITDPKTGQVVRNEITGEIPPDKYLPRLLELGKSADEPTAVAA